MQSHRLDPAPPQLFGSQTTPLLTTSRSAYLANPIRLYDIMSYAPAAISGSDLLGEVIHDAKTMERRSSTGVRDCRIGRGTEPSHERWLRDWRFYEVETGEVVR